MIQTTLDFSLNDVEMLSPGILRVMQETEAEEDARWDAIFAKKVDPDYYSGVQIRSCSTLASHVIAKPINKYQRTSD